METLSRRRATQGRDLDGSQEPRVFHDCEETKSQTGSLVPLPIPLRLRDAPPSWEEHGETRCPLASCQSQEWCRRQPRRHATSTRVFRDLSTRRCHLRGSQEGFT